RPKVSDDPGLMTRVFGTNRLIPVASPQYLLRQKIPQKPAELAALDTISSLRDPLGRDATWQFVQTDGATEAVTHTPKLFCHDLGVQLEAARQGVGAALLPEPVANPLLRTGHLVRLLPGWASSTEILFAVCPTRRGMLPSVRAFLDYIAEHLPPALGLRPLSPRPTDSPS
ncbi:MAG TPA: LysR substrate-binding domain-containing protein, partial [Pseudomonadota bacterium]|nr:LysR substrate-binding domain-containing protein [Pseudomonadota bacterium]